MLSASYNYVPPTSTEEYTVIDPTNLYIKNLDLNVTSNDLFILFRDFGEIVSARVMKDTMTGQSKGYGFVSFRHTEDAHEAIINRNGVLFHTKNISVNYHKPKKTMEQYQKMQTENNPNLNNRFMYIPSEKMTEYPPPFIQQPMDYTTPLAEESVSVTRPIQKERIREAIDSQLSHHQKKDLNSIFYLIQSLTNEELYLCVFNPSFLKYQIEKAYNAIHYLSDQKIQNSTSIATPSLDDDTDSSPNSSVAAILSSLEGMTMNKKKRVFGDTFFPFATGIRRAPKVTIRLLDTVPLDELAFKMYDKKELTKKALQAYSEMFGEDSIPFRNH